ncbi:MAG: efflux RND transporter periplasmic adaptor subunit [Bacteroidaceae bacterium]
MKQVILFAALVVVLASCGGQTTNKKTAVQPILVSVTHPVSNLSNEIITSGIVQSNEIAHLGTRFMGYVKTVYAKKGRTVRAGDLLISISDNEIQAQGKQVDAKIAQAEVAFTIAKRDEERFARLLTTKSISQKEYENVHMQYESMRANLEAAKQMKHEVEANLQYTQIRAPFSGVVTSVSVDRGALASPGMPLVTIEKGGDMVVQTQMGESAIRQIAIGEKGMVSIASLNKIFEAEITERSSSSIATGGQYQVTLQIPKEVQKSLLSGMHADVTFKLESEVTKDQSAIWVSRQALIDQGGLHGLYTISADNMAILHWVRLGNSRGDLVEVLSGINADDTIILPGNYRLHNGLVVKTQN